ncbi:hypothetical protein BJX64DRAFT_297510 [Aspergillus heterothallicus]
MLASIALSGPLLLLALLIPLYLHFFTSTSTPSPSTLTQSQKTHLDEIATALSTIYTTLAEMRYLDHDSIAQPPHNLSSLLPLYTDQYALDPALIYLYTTLPYINPPAVTTRDFLHGASFLDLRDPDQLAQSRDPFYANPDSPGDFAAENGAYMRPWVTPLSALGNHGSVILYDARLRRIWIIDQESWETTDRGIAEEERLTAADDKVLEASTNRNSYARIASRPALEVLRDINAWYRDLVVLPGGGENSLGWGEDEEVDLRALYRRNGWPDAFDGEGFEVDLARGRAWVQGRDRADEPLREVEAVERRRGWLRENMARFRAAIEAPKSADQEWVARFELWRSEALWKELLGEEKRAAKIAAVRCPGGVCAQEDELLLWEAEILRQEVKYNEQSILDNRQWADEFRLSDPERAGEYELDARVKEKELFILRKAYAASVADAERNRPGNSFKSVSGKDSLDQEDLATSIRKIKAAIPEAEEEIREIEAWRVQVPEECLEALDKIDAHLHRHVSELRRKREMLERLESFV